MNITELSHDKTYQLAIGIAERIYAVLDDFPEEEKWGMQSQARSSAFQLTSALAEGLGAIDPRDKKWALGRAHAQAFTAYNALKLAGKTHVLEINPQLMVDLQAVVQALDEAINGATAAIPDWFAEMDPPKKETK